MRHGSGVWGAEGLCDTLPTKTLSTSVANGHWLVPSGHWVLPLVCQHVTVQGGLLGGSVRAVSTGIRFLARVAPYVGLEDTLVGRTVLAVGTREGPVPCVCVDVLLHESFP